MSENIIPLKTTLMQQRGQAPIEIPAAGHLVNAAILVERIRDQAAISLLGMQRAPERIDDIKVHLRAIATLIDEAQAAFEIYGELKACEGMA